MRLARLALQEFRVYADLDLALPAGVVGIYGPNGAGKSTLLDAILWALFGVSKGAKDGLRRDGSTGECRAEVTFEHGGLIYEVARSISAGGIPRAEARSGGRRLASGSTAVRQYVHQVLGMSAEAFRASVFCEQKHLDGFSGRRPEERRRLVLDLLGITPLDGARDNARTDARLAAERVEAIRGVLGDRELLAEELSAAERALEEATQRRAGAEAELRAREAAEAGAQGTLAALEERKVARGRLLGAFQAAISRRDDASRRVVDLRSQLAELADCRARLLELEAAGEELVEARARLRLLETVELARRRVLAAESGGHEAEAGDPGAAEARARHLAPLARQAGERLVGLRATRDMAVVRARQASEESKRAAELDGGAACPLCGQELGVAFASVRQGRELALAEAASDLARLEESCAAAAEEARAAEQLAIEAESDRQASLRALEIWRLAARELESSRIALAEAVRALGADHFDPGEALERLRARMPFLEQAREQAARLGERVRRAGQLSATLEAEEGRAAEAATEAARLLAEGQALGFEAETYEAAISARAIAGKAVEEARSGALEAQLAEARIAERVAGHRARHEQEAERRRELVREEDRARHLGRLSELITGFRNTLVGEVGPALSAETTALFRELTDGRFDGLTLDPDSFELKVLGGGRSISIERHSGSETDLANLALRIAISEQASLLSGGRVGLLVLDEVLGSLDDEHRDRMLDVLGGLGGRFGQVLVVTHQREVKDRLPAAIEVVPLGPGHSEARLTSEESLAAPPRSEALTLQ